MVKVPAVGKLTTCEIEAIPCRTATWLPTGGMGSASAMKALYAVAIAAPPVKVQGAMPAGV